MFPAAYLHGRVSVLDVVLQVAHKHQVTGLIPAGVQGVVVNVAEDGTGTDTVGAILGVNELAEAIHDHSAVLAVALFLVLLRLNSISKRRQKTTAEHRHIFDLATANFLDKIKSNISVNSQTLDSPWRPRLRRWAL